MPTHLSLPPALTAILVITLSLWLTDGAWRAYTAIPVLEAVEADLALAELDRAADRLDTALRRDRLHPDLLAELGRVETMRVTWRNDPNAMISAERAYLLAVANRPQDAALWSELGWARIRTDRPSEAIGAFEQALQRDPNNAYYLASYGRALENAGRLTEARTAYERSLSVTPSNAVTNRLTALDEREASNTGDTEETDVP